ncbi:suppressor protein srp40 [Diplodia corticola]|uniref:Suppressor protein srp40 n=1 Tax=Diplodia corticola TaxID=236234 RepID=A0A1J9RJD7_9PEZI|nr:suppressor protein srp40 [Diplodia corticola]OJD40577.1 suppressor protein srp40 [Diplodia corticola]
MSVTQALTTDSSNARKEPASSSSGAAPERTRLHITPFTPDLLKAFLPPSILPQASRISYHTVQTFPDKGFGYVELPTMEAQKLKKKFGGSILKGQKVRIEDARPEKRKKILEDAQSAAEAGLDEEDRKAGKKIKKLKRKDGVLPGYELPDERHVKRGWTEPESKKDYKRKDRKDKDKKEKKNKPQPSKYTTDKELLFKTKLPPNAVPTAKSDKALEKPKKSKVSSRDVVVHEFSKTTKHASFLKSSQVSKDGKTAAEFVEGTGWVDENGSVVEQETESQRKRREAKAEAKQKRAEAKAAAAAAAAEEEGKNPKRKSALEIAEALAAKRKAAKAAKPAKAAEPADDSSEIEENVSDDRSSVVSTSSSDVSSSDEESEESARSEAESEVAQDEAEESSSESEPQIAHTKAAEQGSIPHGNTGGDVEMTDSAEKVGDAEKEAREVHPLEALFKRPNPPEGGTPTKLAPINTSFSFFGGGDEEEAEAVEEANVPLTPYTRRDLQIRGMRSAAPTPDTAAIGKRFWRNDMDDEEEEDGDEEVEDSMMQVDANSVPIGSRGPEVTMAPEQGSEAEQSEFAKHFWEHRGDYNRAWKKRRREAMKVQRQRENRRLGRKVV